MKDTPIVRAASAGDVERIHALLEIYAARKVVLPRPKEEILSAVGTFVVAEAAGEIRGCAAVRDFGGGLLEVRSLVVDPAFQGQGIGRAIVSGIVEGLRRDRGRWRLFALTLRPEFFRALGFREVPKAVFPEKIWSDCSKCAKRACCDETAVMLESDGY